MTEHADPSAYVPTDPDAVWVGGHRVPENRVLMLTAAEARYELLASTIVPAAETAEPPISSRHAPRRGKADQED